VITAGSGGGESPQAQLDGYRPALLLVVAVALLGLVVAAAGAVVDRRRPAPAAVPDYAYPPVESGSGTGSGTGAGIGADEVLSGR
jgi:hypothetical protein